MTKQRVLVIGPANTGPTMRDFLNDFAKSDSKPLQDLAAIAFSLERFGSPSTLMDMPMPTFQDLEKPRRREPKLKFVRTYKSKEYKRSRVHPKVEYRIGTQYGRRH